MGLFGKAKKAPPAKESITKLRETLEMLEKRESFLEKKIQRETEEAKKFMQQKNKRAALMCIKRKKTYENQCEKIAGARMTIETQVMTIESASINVETMQAMGTGAAALRGLHQNMTVDQVDDTMEDIREQMDVANEISEAISQPLGGVDFDEDDLEAELEALEQEDLEDQLLGANNVQVQAGPQYGMPQMNPTQQVKMPNVPQYGLVEDDEDAELRALEAEMALA